MESRAEYGIARKLAERAETLVVVETSAGGLVSSHLTAIPGSSTWFVGGVVAYSSAARQRWLDVPEENTQRVGAVSAEAALALARAGRDRLGASWGAAETGIAGPQAGRRSAKPVGLAYVAVVGTIQGQAVERVVEVATGLGEREAKRGAFATALLHLLLEMVSHP